MEPIKRRRAEGETHTLTLPVYIISVGVSERMRLKAEITALIWTRTDSFSRRPPGGGRQGGCVYVCGMGLRESIWQVISLETLAI